MANLNMNIQHIFYLLLSLAHIDPGWSRNTNLFGASPEGGLWGVSLSTSSPESAQGLHNTGYPESRFDKHIQAVSYDHDSRKVLMEVEEPHSLYYGPLCSGSKDLPEMLTHLGPAPISDATMGDCMSCKASAFTLFKSKIYFLVVGEFFNSDAMSYTRIAQVREMQSCEDCTDMSRKTRAEWQFVDTVKCSKLIVEVYKQVYDMFNVDNNQLKGGKQMRIEEYSGVKNFFFQIAKIIIPDEGSNQVETTLYHANENGEKKMLHTETIDAHFNNWEMSTLGSLDLKEGLLCWSTGMTLYCGMYDNQTLSARRMVLTPAQGYTSGVCRGDDYVDKLVIVSGVYIVKAANTRHLVFGCYPDQPGAGGTGYVRFDRDSSSIEITPIEDGSTPMKAGSLFVTNSVAKRCSFEPAPPICLGPPPATTEEPEIETEAEAEGEGNEDKPPNDEGGVEIIVDSGENEVQKPAEVQGGDGTASSLVYSFTALILPLILCLLS